MPNSCIPPHQTGHASREAEVVHPLRLAQAAHAADLDVDHPAGTQVERLARVVGRVDALVEADRRLQGGLEPGVVDDVVVGQRLLDQEQVEVVERLERRQVIERVRRVGVDLERRSSGYRSRTRRTTSTSQPGAILSLIRR